MAGLLAYEPFEGLERRGTDVGLGEAIGAGFRIAKPRAGFFPEGRLETEIWEPFQQWIPQYMAGRQVGVPQDEQGRPITDPALLGDQAATSFLSQDLSDRLREQAEMPDEATFTDLMAEMSELGIEIPEGATPEAIEARRQEIYERERENIRTNEEVLSRAGGKTALAGQFIGGFGAELTDPANVATLVIGAPARFGILATAATEGAINAVIEGAQTPGRNDFLRAIGEDEESIIQNMGFGFAFGGVFGGGIKAIKPGVGYAVRGGRTVSGAAVNMFTSRLSPSQRREAAQVVAQSADPEVQAAAQTVLRDLTDLEAGTANTPEAAAKPAEREHNARSEEAERAAHEGRAPNMPDRPVFAEPAHSIINGTLEEVRANDLLVQPERFQFKSEGTGEGGTTAALSTVTEWDPRLAGVVTVFEYADGSRAIADGHQRVGLANRIMREDPAQDILLAAQVYREADGWTVPQVREAAALMNIAQAKDGMTAAMARDAAKILRVNPEAIQNLPVGPGIARARELSSLSDDAFDLMINDVVPEHMAAMVGRMVTDPELHMSVMRLLERTDPRTAAQAESVISQALQAPTIREKTVDLFGEHEVVESLYIERAKVLEKVMASIRNDRSVFRTLDESAGRIEGRGENKLDRSSNRQMREQIEESMAAIQALAHRAGPISEALNNAATRYKETGRLKDAATTVVDAVRAELERGGLSGLGNAGTKQPARAESARAKPPNTAQRFDDPVGEGAAQQIEDTRIEVEPERAAVDAENMVLGEDGDPLRLYHGAGEAFDEFDVTRGADRFGDSGGIFLTSRRGLATEHALRGKKPTVTEHHAKLENPLEVDTRGDDPDTYWLSHAGQISRDLKDGGHDGVIIRAEDGEVMVIALRNDQVMKADAAKKTEAEKPDVITVEDDGFDFHGQTKAQTSDIFGNNMAQPDRALRKEADQYFYDDAFQDLPPESVPVANIIPTQRFISADNLDRVSDATTDTGAFLLRVGDEYFVLDGHHRIAANIVKGENEITAHVLTVGQPDARLSEITPEGEQLLVDGVAPIRNVDRLQATQDKPLRGGDAPAGGLFDEGARAQQDLFEEVPVAREIKGQDEPITQVMSREDLAAELDADDDFVGQLEVCL